LVTWNEVTAADVLMRVFGLIYRPGEPGPTETNEPNDRETRLFSIDVQSGSVLDVLIASARAHGHLGWFVPGLSGPSKLDYSIGFRAFSDMGNISSGRSWGMTRLPPSMLAPNSLR
jgi:hypothetical protein